MFTFSRKSSDGITKPDKTLNFKNKFKANANRYQEEKKRKELKELEVFNANKIYFIKALHKILDDTFPTYEQLEEISKKGKYGYILANSKGVYNTYMHYEYYEPLNWGIYERYLVINDIKFKLYFDKKYIEPFNFTNKRISMQYILNYLSNKSIDGIGKPYYYNGMVYYKWE